MIRVTGANRNTLKEHFRSLVQKRHLVRNGTGKGSWYAVAYFCSSAHRTSVSHIHHQRPFLATNN
jgi:hypothetical protein